MGYQSPGVVPAFSKYLSLIKYPSGSEPLSVFFHAIIPSATLRKLSDVYSLFSFADTMKEIEDITHRTHKNTEITRFVIFGKSSP